MKPEGQAWWRGDPTTAQFRVLRSLAAKAGGTACVLDLRRESPLGLCPRVATFRAMHRLGMLATDAEEVAETSVVTLTEHGRLCAQDVKGSSNGS